MMKGTDVMQGTLDLLILKALSLSPSHGWGISNRIQEMSRDAFKIGQGSLYPALHRFENRGWVTSHWHTTENKRIARYYELTRGKEDAQRGDRGLALYADAVRRSRGGIVNRCLFRENLACGSRGSSSVPGIACWLRRISAWFVE